MRDYLKNNQIQKGWSCGSSGRALPSKITKVLNSNPSTIKTKEKRKSEIGPIRRWVLMGKGRVNGEDKGG
jgi:hypothetical protein